MIWHYDICKCVKNLTKKPTQARVYFWMIFERFGCNRMSHESWYNDNFVRTYSKDTLYNNFINLNLSAIQRLTYDNVTEY